MNPFAGIERPVKAAGDLQLLEQRRCAARHFVLIDRSRRHQRLVSVAEGGRVKDPVNVRMRVIGRLGKRDLTGRRELRPVAAEASHAQPRQSILALTGDKEPRKEVNLFQHHGVAVGNQFAPVLAPRRRHRRGNQAEVAPAIIGADEP